MQSEKGHTLYWVRDFSTTNHVPFRLCREKDPKMGRDQPKVTQLGAPVLSR